VIPIAIALGSAPLPLYFGWPVAIFSALSGYFRVLGILVFDVAVLCVRVAISLGFFAGVEPGVPCADSFVQVFFPACKHCVCRLVRGIVPSRQVLLRSPDMSFHP